MGVGWYSGIFGEHNLGQVLTRRRRPARLYLRLDGHNAAMNSWLPASAGGRHIDPANGHFVLDAAGEPTGLYEDAVDWARDHCRSGAMTIMRPVYATASNLQSARHHRRSDALVAERHMRVYKRLDEAGTWTARCGRPPR